MDLYNKKDCQYVLQQRKSGTGLKNINVKLPWINQFTSILMR